MSNECERCGAPSDWKRQISDLEDDLRDLEDDLDDQAVKASSIAASGAEEDDGERRLSERDADGLRGVMPAVIAGDVARARSELAVFELGLQSGCELQQIIDAARRQARVARAA